MSGRKGKGGGSSVRNECEGRGEGEEGVVPEIHYLMN